MHNIIYIRVVLYSQYAYYEYYPYLQLYELVQYLTFSTAWLLEDLQLARVCKIGGTDEGIRAQEL